MRSCFNMIWWRLSHAGFPLPFQSGCRDYSESKSWPKTTQRPYLKNSNWCFRDLGGLPKTCIRKTHFLVTELQQLTDSWRRLDKGRLLWKEKVTESETSFISCGPLCPICSINFCLCQINSMKMLFFKISSNVHLLAGWNCTNVICNI